MDNGISGVLYLKTPSGILRLVEILFSLCTFISVLVYNSTWSSDAIAFFGATSVIGLLYSLFILAGSIINLGSARTDLWRKINLLLCVVVCIISFAAASLHTSQFKNKEALDSAIICAYLMGFAYFGNIAIKIFTA